MNKKYSALIIGCGAQGAGVGQEKNPDKIINFAHALTEHDGFNLLGFKDSNMDKAADASILWKTDYWSTYAGLLESDIAIVTTPDETHYEILKQLVEYPLKLVIVEKPICENIEQAREIVELYKAKGIPLMVNYTRRFLPYYDHLKEYGKPLFGFCQFSRGWLHTATHAIDFFNMVGCERFHIEEMKTESRVWLLTVMYEDHTFHETRLFDTPVWSYYDKSHMHIINNVYEFLEGREEIKCTGGMALNALEKCYELMEGEK
jgi:hypothetical protein